MSKIISLMAVLLLLVSCDKKPASVAKAEKDPKIAAIEDRVTKTRAEGKQIIAKVQEMKAEYNEQPSTKTVREMVDHYSKNMGAYNITAIGWESSQKKPVLGERAGRWKVVFHYQDYQKQLRAAEWEYNPETNKLYPFEKENAKDFWSSEGAEPQAKGKK